MSEDKRQRILRSRMRLRERFLQRMKDSPAIADAAPGGSGPLNRHGMPRMPPEQKETRKWPVLDLGVQPKISTDIWQLELSGACENPCILTWNDFLQLDQVDDVSDFHCVTQWSRCDIPWRGVRFSDLAALAEVQDDAQHVLCHAFDDYTTNVSLVEAMKPDVLLVHTADNAPLAIDHGGPVRMITPQLWAWKGAKWISRLEFLVEDQPGYWEQRGYSNSAHPWRNDRYS